MKIVSLFSGAGGLDLGLIQAGHRVIWANDIFGDALASYRLNIGDHISEQDIRDIDSTQIPECDAIVGGFPCQGFSVANWNRSARDRRNLLYREMVRIVSDKAPICFVVENVKGITSFAGGTALTQIKKEFEEAGPGYRLHDGIANAADYGVPQKRMRYLMLGIRSDVLAEITFPPEPTHGDPSKLLWGRRPWLSVGTALARVPEPTEPHSLANHTCSQYKLRFNGYLGHRIIDENAPAPTVTARGDERGGVVVIHHPKNHRRMTARELATVQSFPLNYRFCGSMTSAYRQIANAVPPMLGFAVGKTLIALERQLHAGRTSQASIR